MFRLNQSSLAMAGRAAIAARVVPAIHVFAGRELVKTWMPGTGPGMTNCQKSISRI
jgi:hypothetical protein